MQFVKIEWPLNELGYVRTTTKIFSSPFFRFCNLVRIWATRNFSHNQKREFRELSLVMVVMFVKTDEPTKDSCQGTIFCRLARNCRPPNLLEGNFEIGDTGEKFGRCSKEKWLPVERSFSKHNKVMAWWRGPCRAAMLGERFRHSKFVSPFSCLHPHSAIKFVKSFFW